MSETTGELVTTEVEVPYGLNLDFGGPGLIEYGHAVSQDDRLEDDKGKKAAKRIKKMELDLNEEKRREREQMRMREAQDVESMEYTPAQKKRLTTNSQVKQEESDMLIKPPTGPSNARTRLRNLMAENDEQQGSFPFSRTASPILTVIPISYGDQVGRGIKKRKMRRTSTHTHLIQSIPFTAAHWIL